MDNEENKTRLMVKLLNGLKSLISYHRTLMLIAGILSLAIVLLIASEFPGHGEYEWDIFRVYPSSLWILLAISALCGFGILLTQTLSNKQSYGWVSGFGLLVAVNGFILMIPYLRHYAFTTQWDSVMHYGRVNSILLYHRPDLANFYPVAHVLAAVFCLFSGLKAEDALLLLPVFFYLIYLVNVLFLAWMLDSRPNVRGMMAGLAIPLIYGSFSTIFRPTQLTVYMVPCFIAWLYLSRARDSGVEERLPFLLLLVLFTFLHPWAAVASILLLLLPSTIFLLSDRSQVRYIERFYNPLLLIAILWVAWFGSFGVFQWSLSQLISSFILQTSNTSLINFYSMIASQANLTLGKVLSLIFFNYGQGMLYFSLAGMAIVWSLFHLRGKSPLPVFRITLELFVILFGLLAMLSLFKKLLTDSPLRLLNVAATCVPVLVGAWFFKIDTGSRLWGRLARLVVTGLLVVTFILGIISSYGSPLTGSPNIEFTYAQQAGVSFGAKNTPTDGKNIYMMTDNNMLLSAAINYQDLIFMLTRNPQWRMQRAPAHFGQGADYLKLELHNPGSLWIMAYDYAFYTQVWPEGGRFTKEDFTTLDQDINWHKVYTSGDLEIWRHTHLIYNPPINSHGR